MPKTFSQHEQLILAKQAELAALFREAEKDGFSINVGVQIINCAPSFMIGLGVSPSSKMETDHAE